MSGHMAHPSTEKIDHTQEAKSNAINCPVPKWVSNINLHHISGTDREEKVLNKTEGKSIKHKQLCVYFTNATAIILYGKNEYLLNGSSISNSFSIKVCITDYIGGHRLI